MSPKPRGLTSVSREFVFTASDGRIYAWKLGALGTSNPTVRNSPS